MTTKIILVIIAILVLGILILLLHKFKYIQIKRRNSSEVVQPIHRTEHTSKDPNWFVRIIILILLIAFLFWFFKCSGFCVSCQEDKIQKTEKCSTCCEQDISVTINKANKKKSFVHKKTKDGKDTTITTTKKKPNDITDVFDDNVVIINIKQKQSQTDTSRNINNNKNNSDNVYN